MSRLDDVEPGTTVMYGGDMIGTVIEIRERETLSVNHIAHGSERHTYERRAPRRVAVDPARDVSVEDDVFGRYKPSGHGDPRSRRVEIEMEANEICTRTVHVCDDDECDRLIVDPHGSVRPDESPAPPTCSICSTGLPTRDEEPELDQTTLDVMIVAAETGDYNE